MICFNIPGINDHFDLNLFMLRLYNTNREYFRDNVKITSVFGNFHFCTWDGGRNFSHYKQCTKEEIEEVLHHYEAFDMPLRFIFTNPEIKEEHLYNRFNNMILKVCDNGNNEICVNSLILESYIKENYPNYKLVSSTTKRIKNVEQLLKEIDDDSYYQICLDYDLNKNKELLEKIPMEKRDKCEFLINAICRPNCPIRKQHYSWTGKSQLSFLRDKYSVIPGCTITHPSTDPSILGQGNNFTFEELEEYHKMGFKYFKIEGRTLPSAQVFAMYLYYLIKPEYQYDCITLAAQQEGIFFNDPNSAIYAPQVIEKRLYNVSKF